MRKSVGLTLALLLLGGLASADIDYVSLDPIVEARGIWIDAGAIPKTARGIRRMVRNYANAHFNMLLPETICRGYAIYPSAVIERDPRFAGAIDPLQVMIDEAHRLGMEVHPWVWVFRAGYSKDKGSILRAHPGWAELDSTGKDLSPNGGYWISPSNPAARDYLACLYAELAGKYDIDGIHLDYIRYETEEKSSYGFSAESKCVFQKQYGANPTDVQPGTLDQLFWNKFRERQVNTFVQRIALQTRSVRPGIVISAAVGSYPPDARAQLLQNWPNWAANKWADLLTPMSYSTDDARFGRLILRQKEVIGCTALLAEGVAMFMQKDPAQTVAQIGISRQMGALGQIMFSASYCGPAQLDALRRGPYASPAALPFGDLSKACALLSARADVCRSAGRLELADYYATAARSLADYDAYRHRKVPYVVPKLPDAP
jgi:uncharacterized lipoprotein YddW (UPF0748 family)